jgi:hypothetical protein
VATGVSFVALLLAMPRPDQCIVAREQPAEWSSGDSSPLFPLGVRCRYTGPAIETVVVDHQPPLPLVVALPVLTAGTVVVGVWLGVKRP